MLMLASEVAKIWTLWQWEIDYKLERKPKETNWITRNRWDNLKMDPKDSGL